ncbi:hypothetical protein [Rhodoferax antarcticus]|uniref:Uncharacterized protein n=1 Tax=Rhodoferax antarcticus ANT.BR TaxID=1111071 RepID=A0A1Q8YDL8_9BURK|nr:hypothetical protein [Rhodoferax antarcticus]MCW2310433.1 hypothetical protein [Rhodoferax antarcticus]OLP06146.1 hypothetical protein BLL52_2377 [Rhodoferax antarcticus ANT.BR]
MDIIHLAANSDYLITLSSFDLDHQKRVVESSNIRDNKAEFLAIPALSNPRAGFARCKENNHV